MLSNDFFLSAQVFNPQTGASYAQYPYQQPYAIGASAAQVKFESDFFSCIYIEGCHVYSHYSSSSNNHPSSKQLIQVNLI